MTVQDKQVSDADRPRPGKLAAAMSNRARPKRAGAIAVCVVFGWRALLKIKHVPEQLFDVLITPFVFTVMFTYLFGGALAGSPQAYLQFLLPGIMVQSVIFTTIYTGVTLNTDIQKGVYDRFRSLPIWRPAPLVGAMLGDSVRYTISTIVVLVMGLVMGFRPEGGALGVLLAWLLLLVFAFGWGWVFTTLGLLLRAPSAVMTVSFLVLMPVTFASNVFVDPATMPDWLQVIVSVNPVTHMVDAARALMRGESALGMVGLTLITPAVLTLVFGPVAGVLYQRRA